jgi:hypothetical protein
MNHARRLFAVGSVVALAATSMAVAGPAASTSTGKRADPLPLISLKAAADKVTIKKYGSWLYADFGIYTVAGDEAFEVRATRSPDYTDPISAYIHLTGGDIALPDGLMKDFRGLPNFFHLRITDSGGDVVVKRALRFCSSDQTVRVRPDAPDVSTYPLTCPHNPFTLGAVYGIDRGYGMGVINPWTSRLHLGFGHYTATITIDSSYRDLLGLAKEQSVASVRVRVVNGCVNGLHARGPYCKAGSLDASSYGTASGRLASPAKKAPTAAPALAPDPATVPDLRSLPAFGINLTEKGLLNFAATVWNAGPAPLVVDGFRSDTDQNLMDAYQHFYNADGTPAGYDVAGSMEWDPRHGHHHWHFKDFARYRLLDADMNNVVRSRKEAFCLANTDPVDYTMPGADWIPYNADLQTSCGDFGSLSVREVLAIASGDTYFQDLPGQSFNVKDLPNGVYYVAVEANPFGVLHEVDTANNNSYRKIRLSGAGDNRSVRVFPVGLVDHN